MFKQILDLRIENSNSFYAIVLISLLPVSILSSQILINFSVIVIDLLFLFFLIKEKNSYIFKDNLSILLFLFWILILISFLFSINFGNSFPRSFGFLRFILFIFAISYYLSFKEFKYFKFVLIIWLIVFIFISSDLIGEYIFGKDIFGNVSYMPGRLSGVMGKELKIGNYYLGFYFFSIAAIATIFKKKKLLIASIIIFTIVAFLIGERSNFLRILFGLIIFLFLWDEFKIKHKIYISIALICFISLTIFYTEKMRSRYYDIFVKNIVKNGISNYMHTSQYGAHYSTGIKIFKNYPITGSGLKNFYFECLNKKYEDKKFSFYAQRCTTHPHQFHIEILSQVGIFGYLTFLYIFIYFLGRGLILYNKNKNILHLSCLIFIFVSIFIPVPTGSFFTTYGATIFWLNVGLALTFEKVKLKNSIIKTNKS